MNARPHIELPLSECTYFPVVSVKYSESEGLTKKPKKDSKILYPELVESWGNNTLANEFIRPYQPLWWTFVRLNPEHQYADTSAQTALNKDITYAAIRNPDKQNWTHHAHVVHLLELIKDLNYNHKLIGHIKYVFNNFSGRCTLWLQNT